MSFLSELFWNVEYCDAVAVTPAIDVAKLALVTSQDEEEDETDNAGTDSSNGTDATLIDYMAPHPCRARRARWAASSESALHPRALSSGTERG